MYPRTFKTSLSILGLALSLGSCVSLRSTSLTQIPESRSKEVTATSDKFIILGLNFDNDYVDKIVTDLKQKCSGGKVQGILTKDEEVIYFPFFVHKRQVTATGFCNRT